MPELEHIISDRLKKAQSELTELEEKRRELVWKVTEYTELLAAFKLPMRLELREDDDRTTFGSFANATAVQVMKRILKDAGEPLRISELARRAIGGGYGGLDATVEKIVPSFSSAISRSLKSPESPFTKLGRGLVGLGSSEEPIADAEESYF